MPPKNRKNFPKLPPKSKIATENPQNYPKIATEIQNRGAGRVEAVAARDGMAASGSDTEGMVASGASSVPEVRDCG